MIGVLTQLAATVAAPTPAPAPVQPQDQIVVSGKTEDKAKRDAYHFVDKAGVIVADQQAARWEDSICPKVMGVTADIAALAETQVRDIARRVGARIAKPKCEANFAIVFGTPAEGEKILRGYGLPSKFNQVPGSSSAKAPIRWWYGTEKQGRNRHILTAMPPPSLPSNIPLPAFSDGYLTLYEPGDRYQALTIRVIHRAFVFIDVSQVEGRTLSSLIDYAAFVGLAEIRNGVTAPDSILSAFDPKDRAERLTSTDVKFLQTLYSMPLERRAKQQRNALINGMAKQVAKDE